MKKLSLNYLVLIAIAFVFVLPVSAQTGTETSPAPGKFREIRKELMQAQKEIRQDTKEMKKTIKNKVGKIVSGQVSAINGTTLTITKDGKTYTIITDGNTIFRRHFWGKSSLEEISIGDKVTIFGKFTDDSESTILAKLVRDISIQKRFGAFFGDVISKSSDSFVMKSINRGDQTVMTNSSTKFVSRNEKALTFADIQVGHRVRVKGVWDRALNKITEVIHIKDFSLPPRPASSSATP